MHSKKEEQLGMISIQQELLQRKGKKHRQMIKYYSNNSIYSILLVVLFFISCKVKKLKNILILIICLQITIPFIVEGCLRFPVLVSHFFHHNKEHGKSNFIHFLSQHYSEKHHDENHDEHENLPFHNYSNSFRRNQKG